MSEMSWVVIVGLTLIICTKLNEVELSLWDLSYYVALRELKYAIYDGLEMKLKVTKNVFWDDYILSMVQWWWWSVGLSESSVFFAGLCRVLKGVRKKCPEELIAWRKSPMEIAGVLKWVNLNIYCCIRMFQGLERSQFERLVLCPVQGSWNESIWWWITGVLKGVKFWWFAIQPAVMVLKWVTCTNFRFSRMSSSVKGLEMS